MKLTTTILFILLSLRAAFSQENKSDTLKKLPFAISKEKKLPDDELADKKEGVYITGIPDISYDPVNGLGYGGEGELFFNGKRSDPFFEYTPYRAALNIALFNTTNSQREVKIGWDIPYIFNTKWRLRGEVAYETNPNLLYFGIDENSLNPLSYYPGGDSAKSAIDNATYKNYENSLNGGASKNYNRYTKTEAILNVSMERSYLDGKLRALIGYEFANVKIDAFTGNSLLRNDFNSKKIVGLGNNNVSFVQAGFIYDTRNLETDPSNGIFAELLNECSLTALGSQYNFNKTFLHFNLYQSILPNVFKRFVFAARVGIGYTAGNAPFFEYQDQWSSEGSIEGLGGGATLRGYKQSRFLSRVMQFNNIELRYKFAECKLLKQTFAFSAVPFLDAGAVWDSLDRIGEWSSMRYSEGLGLRIAWNVNTILRFDYAVSKEDRQFFFSLGHAF
ncbi:MAG: Omp85 family outer membrane protein [Bacteroidia bacterium]